uniref:Reverse transcriptase n=1 Tax=Cacopsylla melanoneura TaxID=428564 RepID=A0A8D9B128_9HEMI
MSLNPSKTQAIVLSKGVFKPDVFLLGNTVINPATCEKSVKYLGTALTDQIILNKEETVSILNDNINKVVKTPYLKSDQKLTVLNTYIWPILTFKLQHTPIDRWTVPFVDDLDKMVRSAIKQILDLPKDIPDAALYSSKNLRGLQVFRFSWEILIQRLNLFKNIQKQGGVIEKIKDLDMEISRCLTTLNITDPENINAAKIREGLRTQEFGRWGRDENERHWSWVVQRGEIP